MTLDEWWRSLDPATRTSIANDPFAQLTSQVLNNVMRSGRPAVIGTAWAHQQGADFYLTDIAQEHAATNCAVCCQPLERRHDLRETLQRVIDRGVRVQCANGADHPVTTAQRQWMQVHG